MSINVKDKELAAVGISVAAGCRPCTDYHLKKVAESGAPSEEIRQAVADALCVKRSAADIMEAHALVQLGQPQADDCGCGDGNDRTGELVKIGAAYAVNCTENLEKHRALGKALGITDEEIAEIIKLAAFIKDKAASHVEKLVCAETRDASAELKVGGKTCC